MSNVKFPKMVYSFTTHLTQPIIHWYKRTRELLARVSASENLHQEIFIVENCKMDKSILRFLQFHSYINNIMHFNFTFNFSQIISFCNQDVFILLLCNVCSTAELEVL